MSHVVLRGPLSIGDQTTVYPFAVLGHLPQDFKVTETSPTAGLVIGARTVIREHVTLHGATNASVPTRVGDGCYFMVGSHAGHDCQVGNNVVLVNSAALGGHCEVQDNAIIGGLAAIHQFGRVGRYAMVSGDSGLTADVPPFCIAWGRNRLAGINQVGMRRAKFPREHIQKLRTVFRRALQANVPRPDAIALCEAANADCPPAGEIAHFLRQSRRPICSGGLRPPKDLTAFLQAQRRGVAVWNLSDEEEASLG